MDEKNEPKPAADKSLMDKIAADPDIINRSVVDAGESPVVVAPAAPPAPAVHSEASAVTPVSERMGTANTAPMFNLLKPPADPEGAASAVKPEAAPVAAELPRPHKRWPAMVVVAVAVVGLGTVGYLWFSRNQPAKPIAKAPATATPTPTPVPTATPVPATPTPSPTPVPEQVTAPAVTPTAEHPQEVTVTSGSGLWLRSTPNSSNKSNIVGWLPNGAHVSVDQVGDFWWHGTYNGRSGYFAVSYTK